MTTCEHKNIGYAPGIGDYCLDCDVADGIDEIVEVHNGGAGPSRDAMLAWIARARVLLGQTAFDEKATAEHRSERRALLANIPEPTNGTKKGPTT